ncbi:hypothetical protein L6R53_29865, partial [Myxococcota bacterium]|nr:hypothetical protein [Myxococcota bacterium]
TEPAAPAAPTEPAAPAATDPALDRALARVAELERRLADLEDQLGAPAQGGPPSVSGRGGLRVDREQVVRDAVGLGGPVEVSGTVMGTAVGLGADVRVEPGGQVHGDAVSLGGEVVVEEGGSVAGRSLQIGPDDGAEVLLAVPGEGGLSALLHTLARRLAMLLAFVSAGTLALSMWPRQVDEIADRLGDRPFWYGMAGAVLTGALGLGAVVMTLTVIGLPVAVLFLVVLSLAWLMGLVAACRTVGRRLGVAVEQGDLRAWLVGAAVFAVLALVPLAGTLVALVLGFPAVGAAVVAGLSGERPARQW